MTNFWLNTSLVNFLVVHNPQNFEKHGSNRAKSKLKKLIEDKMFIILLLISNQNT